MSRNRFWVLLAGFGLIFGAIGCGGDDDDPAVDKFDTVRAAVQTYVERITSPVTMATDLNTNLSDGDDTNNPFILSVRTAADYAKGHIPGAVNVDYKVLADNLDKLPAKTKDIVTYCYTGHTGGTADTGLNIMGYKSKNLLFGIMGWTKDATVRVKSPFDDANANDFTVETTANEPAADKTLPTLDAITATDKDEILKAAYKNYIASLGSGTPVIKAADLQSNLTDGDTSNDPQIVSVRAAADYAKGHVPGAINIPWKDIAKADKLKMLDPSKDIVVYCYTGHTGALATTALGMMGYKVKNLLHGVMDWTKDATVRVKPPFSETHSAVGDFTVEK
jgi:rhodanese-related sulfurtransferase